MQGFHTVPYPRGKLCNLDVPKFRLAGLNQMRQRPGNSGIGETGKVTDGI
jgi:hypothetical protein